MNIKNTKLKGVLLIEPDVYSDQRGFFKENYNKKNYQKFGLNYNFVQDNQSYSKKNVLRGLHFQKKRPQGKLVNCVKGSVFDVAVDIQPKSETYGQYFGIELSEQNNLQLWIPPQYAHGFCVLSDTAVFQYKCTNYYYPEYESGVIWNDPEINIKWPIGNPILSTKDCELPTLHELNTAL